MSALHPDPFRAADAQPDPEQLAAALEVRGRNASHARLTRRFVAFTGVKPGDRALEVGCGTGVVLRVLAARVGRRGRVVGVDPSRTMLAAAARILKGHPLRRCIALRAGDGARLPFAAARFDATLALTVLLHVADPLAVVKEMMRVTRPGGLVALQDQDFGTVALTHPDRTLTVRIMDGVAGRMYEEPWSGRRLPGLLRRSLRFVPAAVLTAIYAPELFLAQGAVAVSPGNEKLLAGLVACAVAWRFRLTFATIAAGLVALHFFAWLF